MKDFVFYFGDSWDFFYPPFVYSVSETESFREWSESRGMKNKIHFGNALDAPWKQTNGQKIIWHPSREASVAEVTARVVVTALQSHLQILPPPFFGESSSLSFPLSLSLLLSLSTNPRLKVLGFHHNSLYSSSIVLSGLLHLTSAIFFTSLKIINTSVYFHREAKITETVENVFPLRLYRGKIPLENFYFLICTVCFLFRFAIV